MDLENKIREAASFVREKIGDIQIDIAVVLGSGLSDCLAEKMQDAIEIMYKDIPNFPVSTVEGHESKLVIGKIGEISVLLMKGRVHYYEGITLDEVTFPVRVMHLLGINRLLLTNAAGGINESYEPGEIVFISDHINFAGINPLIGKNMNSFGVRFPDMSEVYSISMLNAARDVASEIGINTKEGVYLFTTGPCYETPSEVRMFRTLGADVVGMSTVPEAIVASHQKMKVVGISCVTNMASGVIKGTKLNHEEVIEVGKRVQKDMVSLLSAVIEKIGKM